MEFKLTINMDNGVFKGTNEAERAQELAQILTEYARHFRLDHYLGGILLDSNGNHVGHAWVEETETSSVYAKGNE
jgi:hypothetical protein